MQCVQSRVLRGREFPNNVSDIGLTAARRRRHTVARRRRHSRAALPDRALSAPSGLAGPPARAQPADADSGARAGTLLLRLSHGKTL